MIVRTSLRVRVDLRVKAGLGSRLGEPRPRKPGSEEPAVAETGILAGPLPFVVVLLSCTVVLPPCTVILLEIKSLSGLLMVVKSCEGFFYQMTILEQSKAERRKF